MKMQKNLDLKVETIGEPSIEALPESERKAFLETMLERIKTLKAESDTTKTDNDK